MFKFFQQNITITTLVKNKNLSKEFMFRDSSKSK